MDMASLMMSLLFGTVGFGFLMYGKSMSSLVAIGAGLGLMIAPYLIGNLIVLGVVGVALAGVPFVVRQ